MLNPFLCVYQKFSHDIEKVKLIFMSIQSCQTTSKESKAVLQNPTEGKKYVTQVVRFTVQGFPLKAGFSLRRGRIFHIA